MSGVNLAFVTYNVCLSGGHSNALLAPVGNYYKVPNLLPYQIFVVVLGLCLHPAWCFPIAMSLLLATLFSFQFRDVISQLRNIIDADGNLRDGTDIEQIRRQHQMLCRSVKRADHFMKLFNFAAFCGPLFGAIILLYTVIFFQNVLSDPVILAIDIFWLVGGCAQIAVTTAGGIMVNHYVSNVYII
jgi:hypothetical protein